MIKKTIEYSMTCTASAFRQRLTINQIIEVGKEEEKKRDQQ